MSKYILLVILLVPILSFGQVEFKGSDYIYYNKVGIGKTNGSLTNNAAWLEIGKDSTTKGLIIPRVVDTVNISGAVKGMISYQIKDQSFYYRDNLGWRQINNGIGYMKTSDSTVYYPFWSNPRNYISTETDPSANGKNITLSSGSGITISTPTQSLGSNPTWTINATNGNPVWNAGTIQFIPVSSTTPTSGQVLSYSGAQWTPTTLSSLGTVTSVGLSLPTDIFNVTGSPITGAGTLTGTFKNQFANMVWASPNGISGAPSFRSLTNVDLPNSGVAAGAYGSDTTSSTITVNSKGVVTNIIPGSSNPFIRNQNAYPQSADFKITGTGQVGKLYTTNTNYRAIQSNVTDTIGYATWDFLNQGVRRGYVGWSKYINIGRLSIGAVYNGKEYPLLRIIDTSRILIGDSSSNSSSTLDDGINTLQIRGTVRTESMPSYSSGGISALGRNNTSGRFETYTIQYPISLKDFYTDSTGAASVYRYTVPSSYMANTGDKLKMTFSGTFAATATTHTVGINIGSANIALSNGTTSGGTWQIEALIIRVNNTTVRVSTNFIFDNSGVSTNLTYQNTNEVTGLSLSTNGLPLSISIETPTTNVTAKLGSIIYYPAAP